MHPILAQTSGSIGAFHILLAGKLDQGTEPVDGMHHLAVREGEEHAEHDEAHLHEDDHLPGAQIPVGDEERLDRAHRRWISSTLEGPGAGSEIWTHVFEYSPREIAIQADFFVPGVPLDQKARVGAGYQKLYQGLYDEDEAMMLGRQAALDQKAAKTPLVSEALDLGPVEAVPTQHPLDFDFNGKRWRLVKDRGEFIVYSLTCPHQLGSFVDEALIDGSITCPWHGYRFDVRSGHCLSGHACKLPAPPTVMVRGEKLYAMLAD